MSLWEYVSFNKLGLGIRGEIQIANFGIIYMQLPPTINVLLMFLITTWTDWKNPTRKSTKKSICINFIMVVNHTLKVVVLYYHFDLGDTS